MKRTPTSDLSADEWITLISACVEAGIPADTPKSWRTRGYVGTPSVASVSALTGFPAWRLNSHFPRQKSRAA